MLMNTSTWAAFVTYDELRDEVEVRGRAEVADLYE